MISFLAISFLFSFSCVQSYCPKLTVKYEGIDVFKIHKSMSILSLYQYKSVDHIVKSPFFVSAINTSYLVSENSQVFGVCDYKSLYEGVNKVMFNSVAFNDFNNETNQYTITYNDGDSLFCTEYKMQYVYVIDLENNVFISYYGCEEFLVNGIIKKFEGVLIFYNKNVEVLEMSDQKLNYTKSILEKHANISRFSLQVLSNTQDLKKTSCNLILANQTKNLNCIVDHKQVNEDHIFDDILFGIIVIWILMNICLASVKLFESFKKSNKVKP